MSQAMTAMASCHRAFLANTLSPIFKHKQKKLTPSLVSCGPSKKKDDAPSGAEDMKLAKLAIVTIAAGVLTFGSVHEASAAKTGGRVGGQAFRSSAPKSSSPRINNSRTNVFINPPVAPPLVGGYGFGVPFYGGWGWSPFSFFAPGPSVAIGVGGGFEILILLMVFGALSTIIRRFIGRSEDEEEY